MSRINTNVSSLSAQARLQRTNKDLQTSLTRLSTGLRINSGADDPAGLIASEALRSDITSLNKALTNTQRASQIIATADSALGQVSSLLNDIRGLVVEAANNGALSDDEIAANQLQVDSSLEAINRISQTTTFQGRKLLDGSLDFITKAGAGFSTVTDLKIDQANLGATGQVSVDIAISQAATKASIQNTTIAATGTPQKSTGTITFGTPTPATEATIQIGAPNSYTIGAEASRNIAFTNANTPNGEAEYTTVTIGATNSVEFTIEARDGGIADGTAGNNIKLQVLTTATSGGTAASYDATTKTMTLTIEQGLTGTAAAAALNATAVGTNTWQFTATTNAASTIVNGDADVAPRSLTASTAGTDTANGATVNFKLSAVNGGAADGLKGDSTTIAFTNGATTAATYDSATNAITVTVAAGATINNIVSAINTDLAGDFLATDVANGNYKYVNSTIAAGSFSGGSDPVAAGSFSIEATNGEDVDGTKANTTTFTYTSGATTAATYDATTNTVAVTYAAGATVNQVAAAIVDIDGSNGNKLFQLVPGSTLNGTSKFSPTAATKTVTTSGTDGTNNDVITVTAAKDGSEFDKTITFQTDNSLAVGVAQASVDGSGNIIVKTKNTGDVSLTAIRNAINDLEDFNATITTNNGDSTYSVGVDTAPTIVNLQNGSLGGGLNDDVTFQLTGSLGTETLIFQKGAKIEDVIQSVNLLKDSTGVEAVNVGGVLELNSTTYGSKSTVAIEVISEGSSGTFKSGLSSLRSTGSDIVATVNGFSATGDGNTLSVNTASLDLSLTVAAGSSTSVKFDITGGGALFQLGGDVVSNQQARLGISSVSTAKLGGSSGRLFELGEGQSKSLTNDATGAARVIEEVINKVTSLRGRLGAFQRTTLDSNSVSLTETVANLTEAESTIRDADFAKESANLTRAQILVQSGTNVLSIANQNPQNVLSLLR